jgi:hypothetical protein
MSMLLSEEYNKIKQIYNTSIYSNEDLLFVISDSSAYIKLKEKELELFNNPDYEKFRLMFAMYEYDSDDDELDEEPIIAYQQVLDNLDERKQTAKNIISEYKLVIFVLNDIIEERNKFSSKYTKLNK